MTPKKITSKVEKITPEIALEILTTNDVNRDVRSRRVESLARDMKDGRWLLTGEPIIISEDGKLLDGQHRLLAILEAEMPQELLIVRNVTGESQQAMDIGSKRTAGDILKFMGVEQYSSLISSVVRLYCVREDEPRMYNSTYGGNISDKRIVDTYFTDPEAFSQAGYWASNIRNRSRFGSISAYGYSWYLMHKVDEKDVNLFWSKYSYLEFDGYDDPINALFRASTRSVNSKMKDNRKIQYDQINYSIRAWNAWRKGTTLQVISLRTDRTKSPIPQAR